MAVKMRIRGEKVNCGCFVWELVTGGWWIPWRIQGRRVKFRRFIGELVTGEWMFWPGCPNGGTVILFRTMWITAIFYGIGLVLRSIFSACWPGACQFDIAGPWQNLGDTVPWLGAIFAAVWAALYARFASQWGYLAGVHNQLRQTLVTLKDLNKNLDKANADQLDLWKAEFVRDALDLHLATKPTFGLYILRIIRGKYSGGVPKTFDDYTDDGQERRVWLEGQFKKSSLTRSVTPIRRRKPQILTKPLTAQPIRRNPASRVRRGPGRAGCGTAVAGRADRHLKCRRPIGVARVRCARGVRTFADAGTHDGRVGGLTRSGPRCGAPARAKCCPARSR